MVRETKRQLSYEEPLRTKLLPRDAAAIPGYSDIDRRKVKAVLDKLDLLETHAPLPPAPPVTPTQAINNDPLTFRTLVGEAEPFQHRPGYVQDAVKGREIRLPFMPAILEGVTWFSGCTEDFCKKGYIYQLCSWCTRSVLSQ